MSNKIMIEKIKQAATILEEKDIDMWMIFARESSIMQDPTIEIVIGKNCTWQSAFIIDRKGKTTAIVGSLEEDNYKGNGQFDNVIGYLKSVKEPLVNFLKENKPNKIAINYSKNSVLADGLPYGLYLNLIEHLKGTGFEKKLVSSEEIVSALKGRKSNTEFLIMKDAVDKTLDIFDQVTKFIKPGVSEIEIGNYIKSIVKEKGYGLAWDEDHCPAVFTGPDAGSAHSGPTNKKVKKGHMVNIDFGIEYKGYCSDLQRTWYVLKDDETNAPEPVQKGFNVIRDAIQMVADKLKPGILGCEMDDIARSYVIQQGYEEYPHGLGHQVGRKVHDGGGGLLPRWERYGQTPYMRVEENQVYTIEPRVPVAGYGVSTLEEEVIVRKDGAEFISKPQKKLMLI
ncbi:MAG: aminopeptidase P family protein [Ignavibacteriales bacterium CG_4_9_14_3_um_filter_30_11]|nr:MAG: aminopeptidase P family protein [Ignavibacteriales bacterium CG_4_9_14_3_um_filter_30_11]